MPRAALLGTLPDNVTNEAGSHLMKRLAEREDIEVRGEVVSRTGFESRLDAEQHAVVRSAGPTTRRSRPRPAGVPLARRRIGADPGALRDLAHYLERREVLVAAPDDLFFDGGACST